MAAVGAHTTEASAAPSANSSKEVKPDAATLQAITDCKFLLDLEKNLLDRLSRARNKT